MKRLLLLILLAFALVCFMPAQETSEGEETPQDSFYLAAALSGNDAEHRAVTPDSVTIGIFCRDNGEYFVVSIQTIAERAKETRLKTDERLAFYEKDVVRKSGLKRLYMEALSLRGA